MFTADCLDSAIVPSGQISGPEATKDHEGDCYHPETLSWLIPLRQRFSFIVATIVQLTGDALRFLTLKDAQIEIRYFIPFVGLLRIFTGVKKNAPQHTPCACTRT